jgi:hypothetical protein
MVYTGPNDFTELPMIITHDSFESIEKLLFPSDENDDVVSQGIFKAGVLLVSPVVYNYLNKYFEDNKLNADSALLPDFKISSCIIYKENEIGKEYFMIAYKNDAINYLKRLIISLQEAKELKKEDIDGLIGRIESFIKSL